jgi:hypothetical protein
MEKFEVPFLYSVTFYPNTASNQSNRRFHSFEAATYRRVPALIEIPGYFLHLKIDNH